MLAHAGSTIEVYHYDLRLYKSVSCEFELVYGYYRHVFVDTPPPPGLWPPRPKKHLFENFAQICVYSHLRGRLGAIERPSE